MMTIERYRRGWAPALLLAVLEDVKQRYERFADYLRSPPGGYNQLRADPGFQQTLDALWHLFGVP